MTNNSIKFTLPKKPIDNPILPCVQPSISLWAKAYIYDFKTDEIVLARKQEFEFNNSQQTYVPIDELLTTTTMILGDFNKDKKVTKIEGPFGTENKKVTTVKLGEPYTFTATPNQPIAEFYLLAIKWAYRLDDGELTMFKNQTEIANGTQAQITVTFPKSFKASKIKVYAFFKAASERVCVEVGTDYVVVAENEVIVAEAAATENATEQLADKNEVILTVEMFIKMFPISTNLFKIGENELKQTTIAQFVAALNNIFAEFSINTKIRQSFFLAQIARETGLFKRIDEDLYYKTEKALHAFWTKKQHPLLYTSAATYLKNPEKLGNYVYRNVAENGDEQSGDGFKFRGRGLIQLTRKKGYRRFGKYVGLDLVENPDLMLKNLVLMIRSAGWFWTQGVLLNNGNTKNLNLLSDENDFLEVTRLVHGTANDFKERQKILLNMQNIFNENKIEIQSADYEYNIYSESGLIGYKINNEKRETCQYFYHDKKNEVHDIGRFQLTKIRNLYDNRYKDRIAGEQIYLCDIRTLKNYSKEATAIALKINTNRFFINDIALASLLGAMLDWGFNDFVFNGFSNEKGESVGDSKSHKNGLNGDLRYLRKDFSRKKIHLNLIQETGDPCGWKGLDEKRQNLFNDSLKKYGWKSMLSFKYNKKLLNNTVHDKDHSDHLHIQSFAPTLKKIVLVFFLCLLTIECKKNDIQVQKPIVGSPVQFEDVQDSIKDSIVNNISKEFLGSKIVGEQKIFLLKKYFLAMNREVERPNMADHGQYNISSLTSIYPYKKIKMGTALVNSFVIKMDFEDGDYVSILAVLGKENYPDNCLLLYENTIGESDYTCSSILSSNIITIRRIGYSSKNSEKYMLSGNQFVNYYPKNEIEFREWGGKELIYTKDGLDSTYQYTYSLEGQINKNVKQGYWVEKKYIIEYNKSTIVDGNYVNGIKHGEWGYSPNGPADKVEVYKMGQLIKTFNP